MNYLIFDSDIYYETKEGSGRISRQDTGMILTGYDKDASIAVMDTLQKQVAAPQKDAFNRDQLIAASFSPEYVTQSEQIGNNMFQVIAVERTKVAEIYKCFGFENVRRVVPYGVALREFLKRSGLLDSKKRIVFTGSSGSRGASDGLPQRRIHFTPQALFEQPHCNGSHPQPGELQEPQ